MNIFVLDFDPEICAKYHCDKHVLKMIIESAQLLSWAFQYHGINVGYKLSNTHKNHPCTKWVRESKQNYLWLLELTKYLNKEWQFRWDHDRNHKSYDVVLALPEPIHIPNTGLTNRPVCILEEYKTGDIVEDYRTCYIKDKSRFATWKKREVPEWYKI